MSDQSSDQAPAQEIADEAARAANDGPPPSAEGTAAGEGSTGSQGDVENLESGATSRSAKDAEEEAAGPAEEADEQDPDDPVTTAPVE